MNNIFGTWTLFQRESRRFLKVWLQTIVSPVISNLLFLTIFGLSLSKAAQVFEGLPYLTFIAPGLILMGIINNTFQNPSSSIMIMKYQGIINDLLTVPLKKSELLLAFTASAVLRGLLVGLITFLTTTFFVDFPFTSIFFIFFSTFAISVLFAFLGIIVGIWAYDFDQFAFIQNFLLMPLIFLGGIFYPVSTLSGIFAKISGLNPIVYMIDALRYGFTGIHEFPLLLDFTVTSVLTLIAGLCAYLILKSGWKLQT